VEGDQICLHQDAPSRPELQVSLKDVDSSIALFFNLNRITEPISLAIVPQPASLLTKSLHLTHIVQVDGKPSAVPIHRIPHMLFAVSGTRSHPIYVFFPAMYSPAKKATVHITNKAYEAFYNNIIRPGLLTINDRARSTTLGDNRFAETSQHLPATFEAALATSRATAEQSSKEGGTRGRPINITFTPSSDPQIWEEMAFCVDNPPASEPDGFNFQSFRGLFFLYDSKGTKVETQRQRSLASCLRSFRTDQAAYLPEVQADDHPDDRQYLDIAASTYALDDGNYGRGSTLLAKRCCAMNTIRTILEGDGEDPADPPLPASGRTDPRRVKVTEYPVNLLRDTVSLTAEPTRTHRHVDHGLVYIQTYSPVKELFDAKGIYPFSHPGIINLGYSEEDDRSIHSVQKTTSDRLRAKDADRRSRHRVRVATESNGEDGGWFGWRTEVRVSLALAHVLQEEDARWETFLGEVFQGTQRRARSTATALVPAPPGPVRINDITLPSKAFYVHKTANYRAFLRGNIQKHLVAIDTIRALYGRGQAPSMACAALHALLVLCLRHFIAPLPHKEAWVLTNDLGDPGSDRQPGLGMKATRSKWAFAFLPSDIIDWRALKLKPGFEDKITVPGFRRCVRFRHAQAYQDSRAFLDQLLEIVTPQTPATVCEFVMEKCVHLILQEYRDEALRKLIGEPNARRLHASPQASGKLFSFQGLSSVTEKVGMEVSRVSGNKASFKNARTFFAWLWTDDPATLTQEKINKFAFRAFAKVVWRALENAGSKYATPDRFLTILGYRFFEQHTAVPYPKSCGALVQPHKITKAMVLFCFRPLDAVELVPRYTFLGDLLARVKIDASGKEPLPAPAPVPGCLDMIQTAEEVQMWISRDRNLARYR
jgi:hypothetical protein